MVSIKDNSLQKWYSLEGLWIRQLDEAKKIHSRTIHIVHSSFKLG